MKISLDILPPIMFQIPFDINKHLAPQGRMPSEFDKENLPEPLYISLINEYNQIGFHIGDAALSSTIGISEDKIQCNFSFYNPAIYVPELNTVIYGMESWWGSIKSEEDFKKITDQDIDNTWYVKLWKHINK